MDKEENGGKINQIKSRFYQKAIFLSHSLTRPPHRGRAAPEKTERITKAVGRKAEKINFNSFLVGFD